MPGAAMAILSMTTGEGPKLLSLAPMRARKGLPRVRSCASGPTKGTVAGSEATRGTRRGLSGIAIVSHRVFGNECARSGVLAALCQFCFAHLQDGNNNLWRNREFQAFRTF